LKTLAGRLATASLSVALTAGLAATTAVAATADVRGPDVSSHQHPAGYQIKWSSAKAGGAQFAFVKATEGATYTNPYFAGDFAAVKSAKLVRGAYHYARPKAGAADAIKQARHFVAVAGKMRSAGDLPPVLDLERNEGLKPAALIGWTSAYLKEVKRLTGRTPMIYTYPSFWRSSMADTTAFKAYPLWIATYGARPYLVGGWTRYTFWQYTDRQRLVGMAAPVDMSVFNGSSTALRALANVRKPTPAISAKLSSSAVKVKSSVTLKGSTSRSLAGETLYRQGYWSGSWHTWSTTKVSSTGTYKFKVRPTVKAVNTYRVYVKANSSHAAAASRTVKLRAK
jgi:GH25 family lysozyme M1 (1,4-beta-N-acetylmuramidase)